MTTIRVATEADAEEILAIYAKYIEQTAITFEYVVPSIEEFRGRIRHTLERFPYLAAEKDGKIAGYVDMEQKRSGIGRRLYEELENILKQQGILNVNACIAYPQAEDEYLTKDSVLFHEKLGYTMVGTFHQCGYKFHRWYDMVWMEKFIGEHRENQPDIIPFPKLKMEK